MPRRRDRGLAVFVYGAGKLGTALARALRGAGVRTTLRAARRGLPRSIDADIVVLAVRDHDLRPLAERMQGGHLVPRRAVVVHASGALDAEVLAPLRASCAGVAQMHPLISFASRRIAPGLLRLGMAPRTIPGLDTIAYHAAAGLVANGAAALAALGAELLGRAGVARELAPKMLGPLLRSVADNVESLGFPEALTGPVRRGDAGGVEKHIATLRAKLPEALSLYLAAAQAQLPLARTIGDAPEESFDAVERAIERAKNDPQPRARGRRKQRTHERDRRRLRCRGRPLGGPRR
jgi:predicted short-subunit dehydrogenase-like oxidoreductase (DUF2520 family)